MMMSNEDSLNEIRKKLETEDERKVFDAMLRADSNGDFAKVIEEFSTMGPLDRLVQERAREILEPFRMKGDQLTIHNEITIHPKSYLQMPLDDRRRLAEVCKELKDIRSLHPDDHPDPERKLRDKKDSRPMCKKYRLSFNEDHEDDKKAVCDALCKALSRDERSIKEVAMGGKTINSMKPIEVHRLDGVFRDECKNYDERYIEVGLSFANKQGCEDFRDYCAAIEYAARRFSDAVIVQRNPKSSDSKVYFELVYNDLKRPESKEFKQLSNRFTTLQEICDKHNSKINPGFKSPMMAANHYDKHWKNDNEDDKDDKNSKKYFERAERMTNGSLGDNVTVECIWTQDGSRLKCQYTHATFFAVTFNDPVEDTTVLATMYKRGKKGTDVRKSYIKKEMHKSGETKLIVNIHFVNVYFPTEIV